MAFPTSSLTNNQVHKEGNRAFVYDSTLGVWDQARETDRTGNKIKQGEIGADVTFPAGHIIQYVPGSVGSGVPSTTSETFQVSNVTNTINFTAGNYIYANGVINIYRAGGAVDIGCQGQLSTDDSAGTTGNFGNIVVHYQYTSSDQSIAGRNSQPVFGRIQPSGTSVTVRIKWRAENGGTSHLYSVNCKIDLWEVQA